MCNQRMFSLLPVWPGYHLTVIVVRALPYFPPVIQSRKSTLNRYSTAFCGLTIRSNRRAEVRWNGMPAGVFLAEGRLGESHFPGLRNRVETKAEEGTGTQRCKTGCRWAAKLTIWLSMAP